MVKYTEIDGKYYELTPVTLLTETEILELYDKKKLLEDSILEYPSGSNDKIKTLIDEHNSVIEGDIIYVEYQIMSNSGNMIQ